MGVVSEEKAVRRMKKGCCALAWALLLCMACAGAAGEASLYVYGKGGAGEWDNPVLEEEHPDLTWRGGDSLNGGGTDIVQALTARQPYDLYAINCVDGDFQQIVLKGFARDLSEYPALQDFAASLRPFLREAVTVDGRLYGIPIRLFGSQCAYSPQAFALAGLSEEDVPSTYEELLDFLAARLEEEMPDGVHLVYGTANLRGTLANMMTRALIDRYYSAPEPQRFSSPEVLRIYEKLDALDTSRLDEYLSSLQEGDQYGEPALFAMAYDVMKLESDAEAGDFQPMVLQLDEREEPRIPVQIRLFFISADSPHPDEAALYLQTYLCGLDGTFTIAACKGPHAPVEDASVRREIHAAQAEVEALQAAKPADEEQAEEIAGQIEQATARLKRLKAGRWRVSEADIEAYEARAGMFFVPAYHPLGSPESEGYRSVKMLIDQYAARQIDARAFTSALDQKLAIIALEGR